METHELVIEMKLLERRLTLYEEKYGVLSEDFYHALMAGKLAEYDAYDETRTDFSPNCWIGLQSRPPRSNLSGDNDGVVAAVDVGDVAVGVPVVVPAFLIHQVTELVFAAPVQLQANFPDIALAFALHGGGGLTPAVEVAHQIDAAGAAGARIFEGDV